VRNKDLSDHRPPICQCPGDHRTLPTFFISSYGHVVHPGNDAGSISANWLSVYDQGNFIFQIIQRIISVHVDHTLECGPMPNVMVALPNIGGALCSTPQSLADAHY